jgi:hypothetical protein
MNPHNVLAPVGIKPQNSHWTRNSVLRPSAASGEVFDTNKDFVLLCLFSSCMHFSTRGLKKQSKTTLRSAKNHSVRRLLVMASSMKFPVIVGFWEIFKALEKSYG